MERTLVLIKPDGVQRGLIGEITGRLEQRGLRLVGMKFMQMSADLAGQHYIEHVERPFYKGLVEYITSGPIVAMVWEGTNAIKHVRNTMGATNPLEADPGTIRSDFALEIGRNLVHGSANAEDAAREVDLFFSAEELIEWSRDVDRWVFEG